eukprot:scaffold9373_cov107-Isochrysis_galbana.AAC.6
MPLCLVPAAQNMPRSEASTLAVTFSKTSFTCKSRGTCCSMATTAAGPGDSASRPAPAVTAGAAGESVGARPGEAGAPVATSPSAV